MAEAFKAKIGGRFAPLLILGAEEVDVNHMTTTLNTVITETATEILGKLCLRKKPWVTNELLDLCDKRRALKKSKNLPEGTDAYREVNRSIKKGMQSAKQNWIEGKCREIENSLNEAL